MVLCPFGLSGLYADILFKLLAACLLLQIKTMATMSIIKPKAPPIIGPIINIVGAVSVPDTYYRSQSHES